MPPQTQKLPEATTTTTGARTHSPPRKRQHTSQHAGPTTPLREIYAPAAPQAQAFDSHSVAAAHAAQHAGHTKQPQPRKPASSKGASTVRKPHINPLPDLTTAGSSTPSPARAPPLSMKPCHAVNKAAAPSAAAQPTTTSHKYDNGSEYDPTSDVSSLALGDALGDASSGDDNCEGAGKDRLAPRAHAAALSVMVPTHLGMYRKRIQPLSAPRSASRPCALAQTSGTRMRLASSIVACGVYAQLDRLLT